MSRKLAKRRTRGRKLHSVEAQTSQTEDELRAIIDNAPVFLWSDLPDGYCDFLNQRWLNYFNLSLQEARDTGWATVLHPDDAAHHLESWQKSVATGIPFETEARFRRPDGEYRWFLTRADPLRDKTGRIVKWYGTNIDIENLKRTERRLRQSEANLAEAQRLSHTGSWVLSPATTKILYWSEECYRIWGFDPVQGLPNRETVWRRIHPGDRDRMYEETQEALRQKRDYRVDFRIVLPDGTVKYLEAIGHHLFSEHGELVQVVGTNVDVTERKRAEERLRVQHRVAQILAEAATIEEATPRILRAMGECLGWDVGALWRVDREAEALRCVELWHKASIEVPEFETVSREFTFVPGLGLPGRVWSSLEPEYIPDVVPDENFPRALIAEREGLHAAFGFRILLGGGKSWA